MQTITLTAGTFEPGSLVSGKVVAKWHVWDNIPRYSWGNMYRSVKITFVDNTYLYATEVSGFTSSASETKASHRRISQRQAS
jgi:hypothetical protein